ncbi:MAG: hypothetical protein ABI716_03490 [Candidatus Saccharibacteria bacterium]
MENENKSVEPTTQDQSPEIPSGLPEGFNHKFFSDMETIFGRTLNWGEELNLLYETDMPAFKDRLEDRVDIIIDESDECKNILIELKKIRLQRGDDRPSVSRLKEIRSKVKQIIVSEAGLPDEARFSEIEQAKANIASLLDAQTLPPEAFELLGISKTVNDETQYSFPYDLMPKSVIEKWEAYLALVCEHLQLAAAVGQTGDQKAVEQADKARTYAHNSATNDVHIILGLDGRNGWSKPDTRALLGKMREHELPTANSATNETGLERVRHNSLAISVAANLCGRART